MPLKSVTIESTPNGSRLIGEEIHTAYHLDIPISANDLNTLIIAATRTPDHQLRVNAKGVYADRILTGVRVLVAANMSHFDIPWNFIARGIHSI